jgi:penicillin amidase
MSQTPPPSRIRRLFRFSVKALKYLSVLFLACLVVWSYGCGWLLFAPQKVTQRERLKILTGQSWDIEGPVSIRWNSYAVPFIEASTDYDLAYSLGVVHGHLRLAQIEFLRRVSQARLGESGSRFVASIDESLRVLDIGKVVPEIEAQLPDDTRRWLTRFVAGLNDYQNSITEFPREFRVMGWQPTPFTVRDILTIGRLASVDINIGWYFQWMRLKDEPKWAEFYARFQEIAGTSVTSFTEPDRGLEGLTMATSRAGSNSFVVAGDRTTSGAGMIASDPHVGMLLPNLWLLLGYKSPSHYAIGYSVPGVPIIGIGRNEKIAWGGTNMTSASSDLVVLNADTETKTESSKVKLRWWPDREVEHRVSPVGPLINDVPSFDLPEDAPRIAFRWRGHQVSDELTSFLRASQAQNFQEFHEAYRGYAVAGQNMLYADVEGNIGLVVAVELPARPRKIEELSVSDADPSSWVSEMREGEGVKWNPSPGEPFLVPEDVSNKWWSEMRGPLDLPAAYNPEDGFIVSTNNLPVETDILIAKTFPNNNRASRLKNLLRNDAEVTTQTLAEIQTDIVSEEAARIAKLIAAPYTESADEKIKEAALSLRDWSGAYSPDSSEAVLLHFIAYHFIDSYYTEKFGEAFVPSLKRSPVGWRFIEADLANLSSEDGMLQTLEESIKAALKDAEEFPTWDDWFSSEARHFLSRLPVIGRQYPRASAIGQGSSTTVLKNQAPLRREPYTASFGSVARHISDLGDLDENYFVTFGGNDGWLGSENMVDQVTLWNKRQYIKFPMRRDSIKQTHPIETTLTRQP